LQLAQALIALWLPQCTLSSSSARPVSVNVSAVSVRSPALSVAPNCTPQKFLLDYALHGPMIVLPTLTRSLAWCTIIHMPIDADDIVRFVVCDRKCCRPV